MRRAFALLPLAAAVIAGCGSSNRTESYGGLISKANAICADVNAQTKSAVSSKDFDKALRVGEAGIKKLKALKPPDKLKDSYQTFLGALDSSDPLAKELVAAIDANDQAKAQSLQARSDAANKQVDQAALDVGLTECAKD